jgi:thiosulfate/3-mercaptopyruvate sulfurtransferase
VEESGYTCRVLPDYFIEYEEFRAIRDNANVLLLDARSPEVYEGQGPWIKPGHIPGAVNLPWKRLVDSENPRLLKPVDEIRSLFESVGASPDKTILCSCGAGRCAASLFLALRFLLEYPNVRLYEGSFTEWTAYPDNPTVTGKQPYDEATEPEYYSTLTGKMK